ncbi:MAG TPA: polysaccharide deacetylase family protein, partial [Candidatus Dojkabacteria bacterium]|nr:polysaccharide deacetylase family protein [Candidatus Dojkabacteria bacterium]
IEAQKPKAMMLLIEFKNTDGLANMVNDMRQRNIKGLLMVNADFVEKNVEVIKAVLDTDVVEIVASYDPKPFWEMSYDEQYAIITDMITRIESTLDTNVRVISSRYMASDENTLKIADELGIEYITARGTTELATTIYKPEEYDVKIISVSNIDVPEFKYGSFCDYSFYERSGSPDDMGREYERAITNEKFIGVSHTYIGGQKARWNDMWHSFWDDYEVEWVDLDALGTIDKVMPTWQIPMNTNAPYTPEKIRPAISYDEEVDVTNPCEVEDLTGSKTDDKKVTNNKVVVFHNNTGPMCLEMLEFFNQNDIEYEEHLNIEEEFTTLLRSYKADFTESEGVSTSFGYYPMIFVGDRAFSGFDSTVGEEIMDELDQ